MRENRHPRAHVIVIAVLCLLGIAVSIELTKIHVLTHTDPEFHAVCAVSEGMNCETVALSPYSVFAGLPVSVWGIVGYVLMALLAISRAWRRHLHPMWPNGGLWLLSCVYFLTSVILAYISFARIDSLCLFCMASYAINTLLMLLSIWLLYGYRLNPVSALLADAKALFERPGLLAAIILIGGMSIGATQDLVKPYWGLEGWNDLPDLPMGVDKNGHHWIGAVNPTVTIVEFSDYECPHCRKAHKKIRMLAASHPEEIRLFHRHLPLDKACHPRMRREFHHHACNFARAAECAGVEGRFWEMNDALFSIQDKIKSSDVDVELLAVQIGLDRSAFKKCMLEKRTMTKITADLGTAMKEGLRGTPTFLMRGEKYIGRIPEATLNKLLEESVTGPRISQKETQMK